MELEELQLAWSQMSNELENQKKLTDKIILQMTQEKYTNKFRTLYFFESIGAVICFIAAIYILYHFPKLDNWYLTLCGALCIGVFIGLPVLVLNTLKKIKTINLLENNYKKTIVEYTKYKNRLLKMQQYATVISFILMFATAAVFAKISSNRDFFTVERDIKGYVVICLALLFTWFFSWYGFKKYKGITASAENVLKELE